MDKAREFAMKILYDVHVNGAYANIALMKAFQKNSFDDLSRKFITELVYGAVKAGDTLDWIIKKYVNRPLEKIPPYIHEILRLGMYQIFFLDKIPHSAACNEAVELTKKYGHAGLVKFVNAVLRSAVREPERARINDDDKSIEAIALRFQHPAWMIERFIKEFGYDETVLLCKNNNKSPVLSIRVNTLKITRNDLLNRLKEEAVEAELSSWSDDGILCFSHPALNTWNSLHEGLFQIQDESSMQVSEVLGAKPGEFIIDACSAPGGKATHIATLMKNTGRLLAFDIHEKKIKKIKENATRLGITIIETQCLDARKIGELYFAKADRVLVDVPCSGLGVLSRKPDARWRKNPDEIKKLPDLQSEILHSAANAVKPGGLLVYSTCTILPEENDDVVNSFLRDNTDFKLEKTGELLPLKKRAENTVQFYPQRDFLDGFYIAAMRKES